MARQCSKCPPHRPRKGLRPEAIDEFKRKHEIKTIAPFIADDFDEPLTEDFLLRPLPREFMRLVLDTHVLLAFIERGALGLPTGGRGIADGP